MSEYKHAHVNNKPVYMRKLVTFIIWKINYEHCENTQGTSVSA
jgi:hypothetical protein